MTKKQLAPKLEELFVSNPGKTLSFKDIFRTLHLDTHPLKMLAIDIMEEMAWDDFISKVTDNSYKLNLNGQVQEGVFQSATRCGRLPATACASRIWRVARTILRRRRL